MTNKPTLREEIERIIEDDVILGVDSGQAYFKDTDTAIEKILATIRKHLPEKKNISRGDPNEIYEAQGFDQAIQEVEDMLGGISNG